MAKRKSKVNMRNYTPEKRLETILKINNIHWTAVIHSKEDRDGNMLLQFLFDDNVYKFCGIHGHYKGSVKPRKKKIKRNKKS